MFPKAPQHRSEAWRRAVAALPCAEHCRLQAELDSLRAHAAHLERQLLRLKSATANR